MIWVQIWANLGFSMMVFLAGMQGIPAEVYEAGKIDGTSPWSAFRHLTIPLLAPSITINVLLAIIGTITGFELIFVLDRRRPGVHLADARHVGLQPGVLQQQPVAWLRLGDRDGAVRRSCS